MGFSEKLVKVIFWPRVQKAKKIGRAAELIGEGRAEETLAILSKMERRIPPYVGHLFFLTRGRALDELCRFEEAEQAYVAAVFAKEGATIAYVHLAILCGRQRRLGEARDWLRRIREDKEADEDLLEQADTLEAMIDEVEDGRRLEDIRGRAQTFSRERGLEELELSAALSKLDQWISENPEKAGGDCDELACCLGELLVEAKDGQWMVSLNLEDTYIELPEGSVNPFELTRARLDDEGKLEDLVREQLKEGSEPSLAD